VNCAQFIFGQPGDELPASKFLKDPFCPPLFRSSPVIKTTAQNYGHVQNTIPIICAFSFAFFAFKFKFRVFRVFCG